MLSASKVPINNAATKNVNNKHETISMPSPQVCSSPTPILLAFSKRPPILAHPFPPSHPIKRRPVVDPPQKDLYLRSLFVPKTI